MRRITENLDIDLEKDVWRCHHCARELVSARENYKKGCVVYERDPGEIYRPVVEGEYSFALNREWTSIIEFYCPGCGTMIENEMLPIGHPITYDIEIDIEALKKKTKEGR
ncbi:MAG: acetone carboxylase subunit gamma [Syntrophorhabdales bacterium]|jgi:acetophenone carboxylase